MTRFKTSLIREKIIIKLPSGNSSSLYNADSIANGNRIALGLPVTEQKNLGTYIVRAHNMHVCLSLAAQVYKIFENYKTIPKDYNWQNLWKNITNDYEEHYNPDLWSTIYDSNGHIVFEHGTRHALFDLIEHCARTLDINQYSDVTDLVAAKIKDTAGKNVTIDHNINIALNVQEEKDAIKCGVILRSAERTKTFNYRVLSQDKGSQTLPPISQAMTSAAAFLEGLQMAFFIGMNQAKIQKGLIAKHSDEEKHTRAAQARLKKLAQTIVGLERQYDVRYRPEKPDFVQATEEAQTLAYETL